MKNPTNHFYDNRSLDSLPGEEWVDVPGHENFYKVSNLGRIRRLECIGPDKGGSGRRKSEMILKPTIAGTLNAHTGDSRKSLRVSFFRDKKIFITTVARLVYFCFVEQFDLKDKSLYVLAKDGDPLNVRPENLYLGNSKDKSALMIAAGRRGALPVIDEERRKEIQKKINAVKEANGTYKISRYSLSGKLLQTYPNAAVAAAAMNTSRGNIAATTRPANKKNLTACGYLWRRGCQSEIDITSLLKMKWLGSSPLSKQQERVGQYDLSGNLVRTYSSIKEAVKTIKVHPNSIQKVISGGALTCAGFIWRLSTGKKISVKYLKETPGARHSRYMPEEMKVSQYDLDGKWIKTFATGSEASRATGVDESDIYNTVNDKKMTAGGYLWRNGSRLRLDVNALRRHPHFKRSALEKHMKKKKEKSLEQHAEAVAIDLMK